jgi:hypothetical protein
VARQYFNDRASAAVRHRHVVTRIYSKLGELPDEDKITDFFPLEQAFIL